MAEGGKAGGRRTKAGSSGRTAELRCSFCGKPQPDTWKMIAGPGVYICDECIVLCLSILSSEASGAADEAGGGQDRTACRFAVRQPDGSVVEVAYREDGGSGGSMLFEHCHSCGTWNFGGIPLDAVAACLHCGADMGTRTLHGLAIGGGRFTERARRTIAGAQERASRAAAPAVEPVHLLAVLLEQGADSPAAAALRALGTDVDALRRAVEAAAGEAGPAAPELVLDRPPTAADQPRLAEFGPAATAAICTDAPAFARTLGHDHVGPEHLLLALSLLADAAALLEAAGAGREALRAAVAGQTKA